MGGDRDCVTWREVPSTGGLYEVSSEGEMRSWNGGRWGRRTQPHQMKPQLTESGRLQVHVGKVRHVLVHRLVCEAFHGPCPRGKEAAHLDGNPINNRPSNLAWKTPVENAADKDLHGTTARGEKHPAARLTDAKVVAIRARRRAGERNQDVAAAFDVSPQLVSDIMHGRKWRHVQAGV